jgi:hypothetical protein
VLGVSGFGPKSISQEEWNRTDLSLDARSTAHRFACTPPLFLLYSSCTLYSFTAIHGLCYCLFTYSLVITVLHCNHHCCGTATRVLCSTTALVTVLITGSSPILIACTLSTVLITVLIMYSSSIHPLFCHPLSSSSSIHPIHPLSSSIHP